MHDFLSTSNEDSDTNRPSRPPAESAWSAAFPNLHFRLSDLSTSNKDPDTKKVMCIFLIRPSRPPAERINDLIIEHAAKGHHVVRLKSGDPSVFGRLDEETEADLGGEKVFWNGRWMRSSDKLKFRRQFVVNGIVADKCDADVT